MSDLEYSALIDVLERAYKQASTGKGKARHAAPQGVARVFPEQPICAISRMVGPGFALGQAMKKAHEAAELPADRAVHELLGAINYLAAAVIVIEEKQASGGRDAPPVGADAAARGVEASVYAGGESNYNREANGLIDAYRSAVKSDAKSNVFVMWNTRYLALPEKYRKLVAEATGFNG